MPTPEALLAVATECAWRAGRHTLSLFQQPLVIDVKDDDSPVTQADREAEALCRGIIEQAFPDHGILGEEYGEQEGKVPIRWILDPIDGTKTFVRGVPLYGTLVGVEVEGEPTAGVIYMPALDEMVTGAKGVGAQWNGRPCKVSEVSTLDQSLMLTYDQTLARKVAPGFEKLEAATRMQRTWGDCYAYVLLATGRAEIVVDPQMAIWDCAALLPVVEAAGGRFTDLEGVRTVDGGSAVATNGVLHDDVLAMM